MSPGPDRHRTFQTLWPPRGATLGRRSRGCGRRRSGLAAVPPGPAASPPTDQTRPWRAVHGRHQARPPRTWPGQPPVPLQRAGPDPVSAPLPALGTRPPRRRPLGAGRGPPTAPSRRPQPRPAPRPRGPDATLDDRDRRPDRSPPPTRDVLAVGQRVMPPGKQRRAPGDDGTAPCLRTRSIPKPWPGARHRRRPRAARMLATTGRRRRLVRLPRSGAAVASRPEATEAAGGSSVRYGWRVAAHRED